MSIKGTLAKYTVSRIPEDVLIDIATTCSDRGVAMAAETALRKRYPVNRRYPLLKRKVSS